MIFSRLDVLDAFYDIFQLTVSLLGHNSIVNQGASVLKVTELFTLKWLIYVMNVMNFTFKHTHTHNET